MVHRFQSFEIDEAARELRAGSRVLSMQPRVFDLLVYLAKNRTRVVSKDELLDTIWPDVTVAEGSLQRAVSLARAALAEAGAPDVIRTHSRHGYRFCDHEAADEEKDKLHDKASRDSSALERARAAWERRDWLEAVNAMEKVEDLETLSAADLQQWAHSAQYAGRPRDAIAALERAVAAYAKMDDPIRAAWVALHIGHARLEWREPTLANGWYQRAARLLEDVPPCREKGYLSLLACRMELYSNHIEQALELAKDARTVGEKFKDSDLECLSLAYGGSACLFLGRIGEGVAALDEAGASVAANELSAWAGGLTYCCVIYSCMTRADWQRAGKWTEQYTRWGEEKGIAAYPGLCRVHRAEMLAVRGELTQAEREVRAAAESLALDGPWAEGAAWLVLGEILVARGHFTPAREALARATELGWDSQFNMALLRYAEGDANGAAVLLARTIAECSWSCRTKRGMTLAHHCIAAANAGRIDQAQASLAELEGDSELASTVALQALAAQAKGELAAAQGHVAESITFMRTALRAWLEMEAPLVAAQTRCRLALLLAQEGDREAAALETAAAVAAFKRAGADGLLSNCERIREQLKAEWLFG